MLSLSKHLIINFRQTQNDNLFMAIQQLFKPLTYYSLFFNGRLNQWKPSLAISASASSGPQLSAG